MTKAMDWLRARVPGFGKLTQEERDAIVDFSLLWTLFEARLLDTNASPENICRMVDAWYQTGALKTDIYREELAYFRLRYFANGEFTDHFKHLHLRPPDRETPIREVLNGSNDTARDCVKACLIIVYRYRNNLFHGMKWDYELRDQLQNFTAATNIVLRALEHFHVLEGPRIEE